MNKFVIALSSTLLCTSLYAAKFHHKNSKPIAIPENDSQLISNIVDFSGTWLGQCDNEPVSLKIIQNENQFKTIFNYEDGDIEEDDFPLNKVIYNNVTSPKNNKLTLNYSFLVGNYVSLSVYGIELTATNPSSYEGYNNILTYEMNIMMTKEGNTLKIHDYENPEPCILTKQ